MNVGENVYHFEHGDRLLPSLEEEYTYFLRNRIALRIGKYAESMGAKLFGEKIFVLAYSFQNEQIEKKAIGMMGENEMLIAGHVHVAEINEKAHYANDGFIRHGIGNYILIENGEITLYNDKY